MIDTILEAMVRYPKRSGVAALALLLVTGSVIWWNAVWQNPKRVFEDMLANNLTTSSVTKQASASGNGQSVEQTVRLEMGGTNAADWLVTARQAASSVTTESIGTATTGYIRYTQINTKQKSAASKSLDFSHVLNVWGKADGRTDPSLSGLFNQTLLDISNAPLPPIGNLPTDKRQEILDYMNSESIFAVSYKDVKKGTIQNRSVYTYQVAIKLGAYIRMMQTFAHDLGMTSLDTVDANQYAAIPPIVLSVSVDRLSHDLVKVTYPGTRFTQAYSGWGLVLPVTIPTHTIPTTDLQNRIAAASK